MYSSTTAALLGGTTPNTVDIGTTVVEGTNVTRSGNVVTMAGDNKRYLMLGSVYGEGFSAGTRTQRVIALEYATSENKSTRSYFYARDGANDNNGAMTWDLYETSTGDVALELLCWRGDGVLAGQGGGDVDGSTPSVAANSLIIVEK